MAQTDPTQPISLDTLAVHAGTAADPLHGGVNTPIYPSTAFSYQEGAYPGYPRYGNVPNTKAVLEKMCALEQAEAGVLFSSGMGAISATLLALVGPGDHLLVQRDVYGGSNSFAYNHLASLGVEVSYADPYADALIAACRDNTKAMLIESPSNPLLELLDLREIASRARQIGVVTIIDSTFATPVLQRPLDLGIDLVIHSGTKYLGGHSDLMFGLVLGSQGHIDPIHQKAAALGATLDMQAAWLVERSLKTLGLRVRQQNANALAIAQVLGDMKKVTSVRYPGLPGHPQYHLVESQMNGMGGAIVTFRCTQPNDAWLDELNWIQKAVSLGGVESTISQPYLTSHALLTEEQRAALGIGPDLYRLSVGIESESDLIADLAAKLN